MFFLPPRPPTTQEIILERVILFSFWLLLAGFIYLLLTIAQKLFFKNLSTRKKIITALSISTVLMAILLLYVLGRLPY